MIFYIGLAFIIAGMVTLVFFLKKVNKPKAEGYINDIVMDYYEKDKYKIKQHPHGIVSYVYKSIDYKAKVLLMRRKMEIGDRITLSFKDEAPDKPVMYAPKQELITVIALWIIGLAIMGFCVFAMDYFDLG